MPELAVTRRALLAVAVGTAAGLCSTGAPDARRRPLPTAPTRARQHVVALDPGHGGADPGAISPKGLYEKNIVLTTARELARELERSGRYRGILTRTGDRFVPLRERVALARAARAELLLSIHADALPNYLLHGLSVYTLSERASDRDAAALAARENRDDFIAGVHLGRQPPMIGAILFDLARRETNNRSLRLAKSIVEQLGRAVPLLERPHRAAGFVVLTSPDIPSALVEIGCLSNPRDEQQLPTPAYQRQIAQGLVRAIDDYFAAIVPA